MSEPLLTDHTIDH